MKILRITSGLTHCHNYRELLALDGLPFEDQYKIMQEQDVFIPGTWVRSMNSIRVEAFDLIYYDLKLMKAWLTEQRNSLTDEKFRSLQGSYNHEELLGEIINLYRPDYVFIYAGGMLCLDELARDRLLSYCLGPVNFIGFWADELPKSYSYESFFRGIQKVFVSTESYRKMLCDYGIDSLVIGNCFGTWSSEIIVRKPFQDRDIDILFIGSSGYGIPEHIPRYEFLKKLVMQDDFNVKIISNEPERCYTSKDFRQIAKVFIVNALKALPLWLLTQAERRVRHSRVLTAIRVAISCKVCKTQVQSHYHSVGHSKAEYFNGKHPLYMINPERARKAAVFGRQYYEYLNRAKIVLNIHRSEEHDYGNIRCFEATGMQSVLMTDRVEKMGEFFQEGVEYVGFRTYDDFRARVKLLLGDTKRMESIAKSGFARTMSNYTCDSQCKKLLSALVE